MIGDLRTRVEALRDEWAREGNKTWQASTHELGVMAGLREAAGELSRVLDADPDTPTADAPMDVEQIARIVLPFIGDIFDLPRAQAIARALVVARPWQAEVEALEAQVDRDQHSAMEAWAEAERLRGEVEAARQDTHAQGWDEGYAYRSEGLTPGRNAIGPKDNPYRAARGETRQP